MREACEPWAPGIDQARRRRRRVGAVSAGVGLVAVPTLFGLFPKWGDWPILVRVSVAAAWVLVAVVGVIGQVHRDQVAEADVEHRLHRRTQRTDLALTRILGDLLAPGSRFPLTYEFTVFLANEDTLRLVPLWPVEPRDAKELRTFDPGCGATGLVFQRACSGERDAVVVVTDDAVSDARFGLTIGQQQFFKIYRAVVAVPLWIDQSRPAGVVTAISPVNDRYFDDEVNRAALRQLARTVAEVVYATINPEEAE